MNLDVWVSVVLPILISVVVPLLLGRAQAKSLKVDIEAKYKNMLNEQIDRNDKLLEENYRWQEDYKELKHAFARAVIWVRSRLKDNEEMPDFFKDTGDLQKK